jgi:hypothetical protein
MFQQASLLAICSQLRYSPVTLLFRVCIEMFFFVMPDLIRHPEIFEVTRFPLSRE